MSMDARLCNLARFIGIMLIAMSVAFNPHLIGHAFNNGQEIRTKAFKMAIIVFESVLFAAGLYMRVRPSWFAVRWREMLIGFLSSALAIICVVFFFELAHVFFPDFFRMSPEVVLVPYSGFTYHVEGSGLAYTPYYVMEPNYSGVDPDWWDNYTLHLESNSIGLRDFERNLSECRSIIIGLGDSFAFGTGVELNQSYLSVLEGKLNADGADGVCILKAAMPGYGLHQMNLLYANLSGRFNHSLVLLSYIKKDLDRLNNSYVLLEGNLVREHSLPAIQVCPDRSISFRKKYLNDFYYALFCNSYVFRRLASHKIFVWVFSAILPDERPAASHRWSDREVNMSNEDYFLDIKSKAAQSNASLVVLALCQKNASLRPFFDSNGIVNFEVPCDRTLHYRREGHLNALGNEFVAGRAYDFLVFGNQSFGLPEPA